MREPARVAATLVALSAIALVMSCGSVTAPRRLPDGTRADYSTPEQTLLTLARGIADKGGPGAEAAYLGGFSDSTGPSTPDFNHDFDPLDVSFHENFCGCAAPSRWGVARERTHYRTFLNVRPRHAYALAFETMEDYPDPVPLDDQTVLYRRYWVTATSPAGDSTLVIAVGTSALIFTRIDDRWVITRWTDHIDPAAVIDPVQPEQMSLGRRRLYSTR